MSKGSSTRRAPTVADHIGPRLDILSIGINPSLYTVQHGFHYARPGNRFWPTFNAARIVPVELTPGKDAVEVLFHQYRIGFTNLAVRATARADELTEDDYLHGAKLLKKKLLKHRPLIAWFQGTSAFQKYLEHAEGVKRRILPGLQPETISDTRVFVSPNPSGANPAANPRLLLPWFVQIRDLRDGLGRQHRNKPSAA